MMSWFKQGYFPILEDLLVRQPDWQTHVPLRTLHPDYQIAFQMNHCPSSQSPVSLPQSPTIQCCQNLGFGLPNSPVTPAAAPRAGAHVPMPGGCQLPPTPTLPIQHSIPSPDHSPGANGSPMHRHPNSMTHQHPSVPSQQPYSSSGCWMVQQGAPGSPVHPHPTPMPPGPPMPGGYGMPSPHPHHQSPRQNAFSAMHPSLRAAPGGMPTNISMQPMQPRKDQNSRFEGRVKSFNHKQGFGFIESPEAHAIFGRDVFLHKAQIGDFKVGSLVSYFVETNKQGMPQARDLASLEGTMEANLRRPFNYEGR